MLVTTGAATVVTPQPYQPPVVTQPPVITQPPVTTTVSAQPVGWNTTAVDKGGKNGQQFTYNCSPNGSPATVWGTDVYTNDSSICTSAVHSGLISFQAGGSVTIEIRQGQSSYTGSARNGVTSNGYGSWNGSFVFVGPISQPPYQPPVTTQMDKPNTFYNPTYKGYRLDICLTWGSNCQEPAATKFCQEMGYARAKSWDIAHDIGHITPTYIIGDGKICNQSFCDGFKYIECEGAVTPAVTGARELIGNGTLRNLNGWTIHEWYKPSDGKGEVSIQQPYQPPVTSEPPQQYQPPVTSQPPMGNYPQGDVFTPQGQDDFWKGNIFERK